MPTSVTLKGLSVLRLRMFALQGKFLTGSRQGRRGLAAARPHKVAGSCRIDQSAASGT